MLITLFFLILHLLADCQEIKPHPDGFIITREFAEVMAAKFDSLEFYKIHNEKQITALDTCFSVVSSANEIIINQIKQNELLLNKVNLQSDIIKSYDRVDKINSGLQKAILTEKKKKTFWKVSGITSFALLSTSIIYILIK